MALHSRGQRRLPWGGDIRVDLDEVRSSHTDLKGEHSSPREQEQRLWDRSEVCLFRKSHEDPGGWKWMSRGEMAGGEARAAGRTRSWRVWVIPYIIIYDLITLSLKNTSQAELQASKYKLTASFNNSLDFIVRWFCVGYLRYFEVGHSFFVMINIEITRYLHLFQLVSLGQIPKVEFETRGRCFSSILTYLSRIALQKVESVSTPTDTCLSVCFSILLLPGIESLHQLPVCQPDVRSYMSGHTHEIFVLIFHFFDSS